MNVIQKTLVSNLKDFNAFFVFPTQTAADLWAEYVITNTETTAVAMERFIAWDKFKGTSIRGQQQDKKSIPSALKSIFVSNLISENAEKPFFKNLIVPAYAKDAAGFAQWITGLLAPLGVWKKHFEAAGLAPDEEDADLMLLYEKYSEFLNKYGLFEPAWENPPFKEDGNKYFIFFPEILSDYCEYEEILANSPDNIRIVHVPEEDLDDGGDVQVFENSRKELKNVSLYLRALHEEKNIPWENIALSVPDMENYAPYIERDLRIYQIPYVIRSAKNLSSCGAGTLFSQIVNCVEQKFSFSSIKELLLNNELPWQKSLPIFPLINFGKENNCVCSFRYKGEDYDIWEKSFSNPVREPDELSLKFYKALKKDMTALAEAKTFSELRENYFIFRTHFMDMENCSVKSDLLLSRCLSELGELIKIEEHYKVSVPSPLSFFITHLSGIDYLEQTELSGVQVLPYKLASCAPFDAQLVLDSSQSALSVVYKQFSFLRDDKRLKLLKDKSEINVSDLFVKLYRLNSVKHPVLFTCAEKTFTGYAQPSSYLEEKKASESAEFVKLQENDFYEKEKNFFLKEEGAFPEKISFTEKVGLSEWLKSQKIKQPDVKEARTIVEEKLRHSYYFTEDGKVKISASSLNSFFDCPRLWALERSGKLKSQSSSVELVDHLILGNLYHKVFELFLKELKQKNLPLMVENDLLSASYREVLTSCVKNALETERNSFLAREMLKTTQDSVMDEAFAAVTEFSKIFQGCSVYASEEGYQFEDVENNCVFDGRVDCILMEPSSTEYILVDFKSFKNAVPSNLYVDEENGIIPNFQMPVYIHLLKSKGIEIENCCFFDISKQTVKYVFGEELGSILGKKKGLLSAADFSPVMEVFEEAVRDFVKCLQASDFSVSNSNQDFETCNKCNKKAVCRRTFNVSRKN